VNGRAASVLVVACRDVSLYSVLKWACSFKSEAKREARKEAKKEATAPKGMLSERWVATPVVDASAQQVLKLHQPTTAPKHFQAPN
jgi:hypothetical protein